MAWSNIGNIRGPAGPAGPQGVQGPAGADGQPGPRGATWRNGTTAPSRISADMAGDMYQNLTTGEVYVFSGSTWVRQGALSPIQLARIQLRANARWILGANTDWVATSNQWELDMAVGTAIVPYINSSGIYFKVNAAGLYRTTFNINGGAHSGNLSVKMTRNAAVVGGNTVFSWSGTSSESAVAATGLFHLSAGDTVYPVFWSNPGWTIITDAFGQADTAITLELVTT